MEKKEGLNYFKEICSYTYLKVHKKNNNNEYLNPVEILYYYIYGNKKMNNMEI